MRVTCRGTSLRSAAAAASVAHAEAPTARRHPRRDRCPWPCRLSAKAFGSPPRRIQRAPWRVPRRRLPSTLVRSAAIALRSGSLPPESSGGGSRPQRRSPRARVTRSLARHAQSWTEAP
eukprot:5486913-Prymnesium_polylepis.1